MIISCETLWDGDAIMLFEALADGFMRNNRGMMAPGKSYPLAYGEPYTHEERREKYDAWRSVLGPVDKAAIVSMYLLRQSRAEESEEA